MFDITEFILNTLKDMIGNEPDYKVRQYAAGWYDKGVLTENELSEIDVLIVKKKEQREQFVEIV